MNNETYGISLEVAIADAFDVEVNGDYRERADEMVVENAIPVVLSLFEEYELPYPADHVAEGQNPIDFILEDGTTLSVKSNFDGLGKAAPQVIGQASAKTWYEYFEQYIPNEEDSIYYNEMSYEEQGEVFKKTVLANPADLLREYFSNIFECDYLFYGYHMRGEAENMDALLLGKYGFVPDWQNEDFTFTRNSVDDWNESSTIKYLGVSIGEFQVHTHRDCFKFRFNMDHLIDLLEDDAIPFTL